MFSELYDDDTMKAVKVGDAFDLAYICVILAAIGKAIPNIEKEEDAIYFLKGEGSNKCENLHPIILAAYLILLG